MGSRTKLKGSHLSYPQVLRFIGGAEGDQTLSDGHASIVLTLDTYSHVLPSMQQAATAKLENLLFKPTGTL
jgi:hypothetical protein